MNHIVHEVTYKRKSAMAPSYHPSIFYTLQTRLSLPFAFATPFTAIDQYFIAIFDVMPGGFSGAPPTAQYSTADSRLLELLGSKAV